MSFLTQRRTIINSVVGFGKKAKGWKETRKEKRGWEEK
jgi:hypothetical protein